MYKEIVDLKFSWKNFTIKEQVKVLSSRRSNTYLETTLLKNLFPEIKNIKDALRDVLKKYKCNFKLFMSLKFFFKNN